MTAASHSRALSAAAIASATVAKCPAIPDSLGLRHELDVRLDHNRQRSLGTDDEIREIERAAFREHSLEAISARPPPEGRSIAADRRRVFFHETRHLAMELRVEIFANLKPWQCVQVARHPNRPEE